MDITNDIIKLAVLLHDIGRKKENKTMECHAEISARLAKNILARHRLSRKIAGNVIHCIECHRFRKGKKPETIEAKVLYDADKLDAIGAIGICRAYSWAGEHGQKLYSDFAGMCGAGTGYGKSHTPVKEFTGKLSRIKSKMFTESGKEISKERHRFTLAFFRRLEKETKGLLN